MTKGLSKRVYRSLGKLNLTNTVKACKQWHGTKPEFSFLGDLKKGIYEQNKFCFNAPLCVRR